MKVLQVNCLLAASWMFCTLWCIPFDKKMYGTALFCMVMALGTSVAAAAITPFEWSTKGLRLTSPPALLAGWLIFASAINAALYMHKRYGYKRDEMQTRLGITALCAVSTAFAIAAIAPLVALPATLPAFMKRDGAGGTDGALHLCTRALLLASGAVLAFVRA